MIAFVFGECVCARVRVHVRVNVLMHFVCVCVCAYAYASACACACACVCAYERAYACACAHAFAYAYACARIYDVVCSHVACVRIGSAHIFTSLHHSYSHFHTGGGASPRPLHLRDPSSNDITSVNNSISATSSVPVQPPSPSPIPKNTPHTYALLSNIIYAHISSKTSTYIHAHTLTATTKPLLCLSHEKVIT